MKGYCKCSEHLENNVSSWNYTKVVAGIANFVHEMHHTGVTHCYKKSVLTLFFLIMHRFRASGHNASYY